MDWCESAKADPLSGVGLRPRNALEIDAFFHQLFGFLGRGFTMDRTGFFFAIVNLARFVRELVADIIAIFLDLLFQLVQKNERICF